MQNSEQIKAASEAEAERAAVALADAIATIEQYRAYIPEKHYCAISGAITDMVTSQDWLSDPDATRKIMPAILRYSIERREEEDE
jgi:hypothetical protein